jgi:hypothetical protein
MAKAKACDKPANPSDRKGEKEMLVAKARDPSEAVVAYGNIMEIGGIRGRGATSRSLNLIQGDNPFFQRIDHRLGVVGQLQFGQDIAHVCLHGLVADGQGFGDLVVGAPKFESSFIRNLTIFSTKSYGIGLSNGKCTEPFVPLYCDNSFLNASVPEGIGYSAI